MLYECWEASNRRYEISVFDAKSLQWCMNLEPMTSTKTLIFLVFMTGLEVSCHLFNMSSKEALIKKTQDGPKYFHSLWCVFKYHKCLSVWSHFWK